MLVKLISCCLKRVGCVRQFALANRHDVTSNGSCPTEQAELYRAPSQ